MSEARGRDARRNSVRKKLASVAALLLVTVGLTRAAERDDEGIAPSQTVTLPEALALLESENPEARAARLDVARADAERAAVRLYLNPTLSVDTANIPAGRTNPPGLSADQTIGATVRVDQPLVLWGKRHLRLQGAEAGVAGATEQEQDVLRQLRAAVKAAFFDVVHDEKVLAFALDNQRRYQKIVALNERRFTSGDIAEADFRKIELEQLKYVAQLERARRGLSESEQLLGRLLGKADPVAASGGLAPPAVEVGGKDKDLVELALRNRPDLAALQKERERADLALRLARRERYPDVTVGIDYTHSEFAIAGDNRNTVGFGFSVPLPVLNQNQADIAKAEIALREADNDLARLRLDVAQEVRDAMEGYRSTERLWHTFEDGYLDRAKVTVDAAEASYRIGAASLIELFDAERTYTETRNDYLDTTAAARMSLIALDKAVGKDLEGD